MFYVYNQLFILYLVVVSIEIRKVVETAIGCVCLDDNFAMECEKKYWINQFSACLF